jgi:ammonia channel protein AmtB
VFKWDDALDVWGVHGMGGFLGSVLLGALADEDVAGGFCKRSGEFFGKQARPLAELRKEGLWSLYVGF